MADPLRFLVVIDNFHPLVGGAEQAALESARALAARGHRVDVLTMRKRPEWPAEERLGDLRVFRFGERIPPRPVGRLLYERWNAAAAAEHLRRHLDADAYDAMLLHPICAAFGVARAAAGSRAALIYCFHAPLGEEARVQAQGTLGALPSPLHRLAARLTARWTVRYREREQRAAILRSDGVTCPSRYAASLLCSLLPPWAQKPTQVIPWGVDAERFRPAADRAAVRASLGWRPEETVLLTVRRLVPRMGLDALVRAFGLMAARRPGLRLVLVGGGPLRAELERAAREGGGRVDFAGFVPAEELPRYFQAADLFVLPSTALEAFGLVVLESLACGTPVLATARGAPPEILGPLDPRLLIPNDEPAALANTLLATGLAVAAEPGFRDRCRAYAVENHPWARTADELERLATWLVQCKAEGRRT